MDSQVTGMKPSSDGTAMQGSGHSSPNTQCAANISSCGVVHVLRCADCGYETILRERFITHNPCANRLQHYPLYICSQCGTCSTSRRLVQEHGEFCHRNQSFAIEERFEEFRPLSKEHTYQSRDESSRLKDSRDTHLLLGMKLATSPDSTLSSSNIREPSNNDTYQLSIKADAFGPVKPASLPEDPAHPLFHLANLFNTDKTQVRNQQPTPSEQPELSNPIQCSLCQQTVGYGIEDLAKHLALIHLLPFPSILTHLSVLMTHTSLESAERTGPRRPLMCAHTTATPLDGSHWCSTPEYPGVTSASSSHKKSMKRSYSPKEHVSREVSQQASATEMNPNANLGLTCPQCSKVFPTMYQLQLHFMQEHSSDIGSLLNMGGALTTGRIPFPPFFSPCGVPLTHQGNLATSFPNPYTRDSVPQLPSKCPQTAIQQTGRPAFSNSMGAECGGQIIHEPSIHPINLIQLRLATAAAALGIPYQTDLSLLSHEAFPVSFGEEGACITTTASTIPDAIISTDSSGRTPLDAKRLKMQTCLDNLELTTQAPLSNGPMGKDTAPLQWLNGAFSRQVNKLPTFPTEPTQAHPKPSEYIYQPAFNSELFANPTEAAAPVVIQPNFSSRSNSLSIFPSLCASLNRTVGQLDQNHPNGSCPDDTFAKHRSNLQSSPPGTPTDVMVTNLSKLDASPCDQMSELDRSEDRSAKPHKLNTFAQNVLKSTSDSLSTPGTAESQGNAANGIVHNTLRKTRSDMKVIHRYLMQVKHDTRDIHLIPHYELDQYIQDFVLTAKKKDGHEYEPESLKAFVHSLERHLKHHDYPHSVLKGNAFAGTRTVLNQRLSELRALSRSGSTTMGALNTCTMDTKRSTDQTATESVIQSSGTKRSLMGRNFTPSGLIQAGLLGKDNPQAILNSLWLMNRTQFNIGGTQRHRNLVWGQFQLVTDETGTKAIKFTPLFESAEVRYCRGYGGVRGCAPDGNGRSLGSTQALSCTGAAKRQPLPFNCIELFEIYGNLRSPDACGVSEPFYLCPEPLWEQTGNWFKTNAAGSQLLARIPRLLGLKPNRELAQSSAHVGRDFEPTQICSYEMTQNAINSTRYDPTKHGNGKLSTSVSGRQMPEKRPLQMQDQARFTFPAVCPSLAHSFFNFFPLMFPPGSDPVSLPTTSKFPCLLPPNTAYPKAIPLNPEPVLPTESHINHETQVLPQYTPIRLGQKQEDNFDRLGESEYPNLDEQTFSSERQKRSPSQQVGSYTGSVSSSATESPKDGKNVPISDTIQPKKLVPRLRTGTKGTLSSSGLKDDQSPQNSSDSHTSSRPQSVASRFSLMESSESLSRIEIHTDPNSTHTQEQRTTSGLPNEALNLVSGKEESSYA